MKSGELVASARAALGMNRDELAAALGMSAKSIAEFETGHQAVRRVVFHAIENLLRRDARIVDVVSFREKWERIA